MSVIKKCQEATKVLNELSTAAVSARSEVQKLLTVLDGPAVNDVHVSNIQNKSVLTPYAPPLHSETCFSDGSWCSSGQHGEIPIINTGYQYPDKPSADEIHISTTYGW